MIGDMTKYVVLATLVAFCLLGADAAPCFSQAAEPAPVILLAAGPGKHVIKSGDTINLLAHRYGVPGAAIVKANPGLDPARMQLGRTIVIPEAGGHVGEQTPEPVAKATSVELRPEKAPQATPPLQEHDLKPTVAAAPAKTAAQPAAPQTADTSKAQAPGKPETDGGKAAAAVTETPSPPAPAVPVAVDKVGSRTRIAFGGTAIFVDQIVPWLLSLGSRLFSALLVFMVGVWLSNRMAWLLQRMLTRKNVPPEIISFARSLTRYGLYLVVLIAALGQIGVNVSSLLALFGAAGLAISLALKDTLSNFASGIMLLLFRFFRVGDRVSVASVAGATGLVESMDIFNTIIRADNGDTIIVPNAKIVGNVIVVGNP